jgi:hypothetical protein
LAIPSIRDEEKVTSEPFVPGVSEEIRGTRLVDGVEQRVHHVDDQVLDVDITSSLGVVPAGNVEVGPLGVSSSQEELGLGEPNMATCPSPDSGPGCFVNEGHIGNLPIIEHLDTLITKSRGKQAVTVSSDLSSETQQHFEEKETRGPKAPISKSSKNRKNSSRLPFPSMAGPKCMRLVGMINGSGLPPVRRRKGGGEGRTTSDSSLNSEEHQLAPGAGEQPATVEVEAVDDERVAIGSDAPGIVLEVVLPAPTPISGQSGVQLVMGDHSLHDVEGFLASRGDPGGALLEAENLIQLQQDLGVSFNPNEQVPIDRLLQMEDRDRKDLAKWQESNGPQ